MTNNYKVGFAIGFIKALLSQKTIIRSDLIQGLKILLDKLEEKTEIKQRRKR